jgi:hypothetical protein
VADDHCDGRTTKHAGGSSTTAAARAKGRVVVAQIKAALAGMRRTSSGSSGSAQDVV